MGMKRDAYEAALEPLTHELVSMARWAKASGARIVVTSPSKATFTSRTASSGDLSSLGRAAFLRSA